MASFAVATKLFDDDRTAHSALKILVPVHSESTCTIDADSQLAHELFKTHLLIWDEIVMTHRYNLEVVDRTLCDLRRCTFPIDVVFMLCLGDFRHILPVVRAASRSQIVNAFFKRSRLYPLFKCLHFQEIMRLQALCEDPLVTPDALQFP